MYMNNSNNPETFFQAVLEGFADGVLVVTESQEVLYANITAQRLCAELSDRAGLLPAAVLQVCAAMIESRSLYPHKTIAIESELTTRKTTYRIRSAWLEIEAAPHLLIRLQDQNQSAQGLAIAEAQKWRLSPRETEVWLLKRAGYERKEIAETLYIALDTVKKHLKNVQMKRQSALDEASWHKIQAS